MRDNHHRAGSTVWQPEQQFGSRVVGFFPGLGSRAFYDDLGRFLLDSQIPEVVGLYHEGAVALGHSGRPERLLFVAENIPESKTERQGFVGAAFLLHNLALEAYLRVVARQNDAQLSFQAYTGESFGLLASAVASGSLSVRDGVKIAHVFTPLMMLAAEGEAPRDPLADRLSAYLPDSLKGRALVKEPSYVMALQGGGDDIAEAVAVINSTFARADVEVHKTYSARQTNLYVRSGARSSFHLFMHRFPGLRVVELKAPVRFLAHSQQMKEVRPALASFIDKNDIVFTQPHTPVVSNNDAGLLTTADEIRAGVLAIIDEVMASQSTAETVNSLRPDMILELGLGNKSLELLAENKVDAPMMAYTGTSDQTRLLLRIIQLMTNVTEDLESLPPSTERLEPPQYAVLREMFRLAYASPFCERYFQRRMERLILQAMLGHSRDRPQAYYRFLEVFQHTCSHRNSLDHGRGELVLRARLKKRTDDAAASLGQVDAELLVIDSSGVVTGRRLLNVAQPEAVILHFDARFGPDAAELDSRVRRLLDREPMARQIHQELRRCLRTQQSLSQGLLTAAERLAVSHIAYRCALFQALRIHRPALFAQSDHYLEGSDPLGWLVALAVSGTAPLGPILQLCVAHLAADGPPAAIRTALDDLLSCLTIAEIPVISPNGVPFRRRGDLAAATRRVFLEGALDTPTRPIHLNGNCQILALGSAFEHSRAEVGAHRADVIQVLSATEIWNRGGNPSLDEFEDHAILTLTVENEAVMKYARGRKLLHSTVNSYVHIGERILGFGQGGSESMTVFLKKEDDSMITVRKVLGEALTTARWDPEGEGVMLPPFEKAKKQAEYLQALPAAVNKYFPYVYDVLERRIPIPPHLRKDGKTSYQEVIYEMGYVAGDEVSRFIERHLPPPAVIARLYEEILRLLNRHVHTVDRRTAPGRTLDISYFKKIEDRLALCQFTAPRTFSPDLTSTEFIVINGVRYLNSSALLKQFRQHPKYLAILEPPFHSLVMGDTNTENIKIANPEPLLRAQRLIEGGAPEAEINEALTAITHDALGIRFLDPRAIGFGGEGRDTRDDPMYDNKIWHNSIGHYDEIHFEQFRLQVRTGAGQSPCIDIEFLEGNPYQRAYQVRDVMVRNAAIDDGDGPRGMEDYFRPIMTAVHQLDDAESTFTREDPYWLIRFVFVMGTHFAAMPPFHFQRELDGTLTDTYQTQRRPVAIYCEGIKWLNWALEMLDGTRTEFLGLRVQQLPFRAAPQVPPSPRHAPQGSVSEYIQQ
jgi:malonyl CoA-acyl carrier protein transacylase